MMIRKMLEITRIMPIGENESMITCCLTRVGITVFYFIMYKSMST